jgi:hypothetical protein
MAKYDPLCRFLRDSGEQDLEDRNGRMWWSNTADPRHVQASAGWLAAGYVVAAVDYAQRRVRFRRQDSKPAPAPPSA